MSENSLWATFWVCAAAVFLGFIYLLIHVHDNNRQFNENCIKAGGSTVNGYCIMGRVPNG